VQRLFPVDDDARREEPEPYASLDLPDGAAERPCVIANMVSTVDGATAIEGTARGIGSGTDRRMMRLLRSKVDALLIGAATLRAEIVDPRVPPDLAADRVARGEPAQPLAVTVSRTLDLDPDCRYFVHGLERSIVITTEDAASRRGATFDHVATLLTTPGDDVDLAAALTTLRQRWGVNRLLCEGGPTLNRRLLDLGLLDEVFWTIAPKLAGGPGPGLLRLKESAERISANLSLVSVFEHGGELFTRYRVIRPEA
jgi:riboflavin-specific deaminase-like protein